MKITSITSIITRPPIRHPGKLGVGDLVSVDAVIVAIETDAGISGVGECSPWAVFAENAFAIKATIDNYLAPALIGETPFNIEAILLKMDAAHYGSSFAKTGVEMAVFDIVGKALDCPVNQLLGGLVRDRISLSYSVTNQETQADLEESRWLLDQGFKVLKIKTGVLPEREELIRVEALRKLVGDDFDLRIDFNQGGRREQMTRLCRQLEAFKPTFIEQPFKGFDLDAMAALCAVLDTPIMADESVLSWDQGFQVAKRQAADIISIKIAKMGGLLRSKKVAGMCEAAGVPCYAGAMWESGIGLAASLHFACSSPAIKYGSDFYTANYLMTDDLVVSPLAVSDGAIFVPTGPGLGVEADWEAIERYRVAV
ncbi:cycloisomerase [Mesorhizobium sp. BH1-1-5]|uniref:mandelate racemase/muconate lactonizing enzyme family protein n=1 Tax=unclassified Mesorhizobium TaxID=325217 RepID=UPI00112D67FB|nr:MULTISPECIES: enolase C-terminal domain-like protein [unclassified Mesorhizobium]MBZ9988864.1 cycloisomerase [Mesorhizobium sp. BH1-1-5]TPJ61066.1 cycloisomerase [Mesorhizobium sp. B2-7-1]